MKISHEFKRTARSHGGIFLGLRLSFPVSLAEDAFPALHWRRVTHSLGLVFWTWSITFDYGFRMEEDGC